MWYGNIHVIIPPRSLPYFGIPLGEKEIGCCGAYPLRILRVPSYTHVYPTSTWGGYLSDLETQTFIIWDKKFG